MAIQWLFGNGPLAICRGIQEFIWFTRCRSRPSDSSNFVSGLLRIKCDCTKQKFHNCGNSKAPELIRRIFNFVPGRFRTPCDCSNFGFFNFGSRPPRHQTKRNTEHQRQGRTFGLSCPGPFFIFNTFGEFRGTRIDFQILGLFRIYCDCKKQREFQGTGIDTS